MSISYMETDWFDFYLHENLTERKRMVVPDSWRLSSDMLAMCLSRSRLPLLNVLRNCCSSSSMMLFTIWGSLFSSGNASPWKNQRPVGHWDCGLTDCHLLAVSGKGDGREMEYEEKGEPLQLWLWEWTVTPPPGHGCFIPCIYMYYY